MSPRDLFQVINRRALWAAITERDWIREALHASLMPNADSVRTMISCPWRTGTYRSSSSAHCGRLMERFGVAMPFIPWDCIKGAVCKTVGFSRRDTRRYVFGNRVAEGGLDRIYQGKREPDHGTSE